MAAFRAPPISDTIYTTKELRGQNMADVWVRWLNDLFTNVGGIRGTRRVAGEIIDIYGSSARIPTGALLCDGKTIGNESSGATARANADTIDLYTVLWEDFSQTENPVSKGGRGSSARADFNAGKTIGLPNLAGYVLAGTGTNTGLTQRDLGFSTGSEEVTLTGAQSGTGAHSHAVTDAGHSHSDSGHTHGAGSYSVIIKQGSGGSYASNKAQQALVTGAESTASVSGTSGSGTASISPNTTGITIDNATEADASEAHNNMQPTIFVTKAIFL